MEPYEVPDTGSLKTEAADEADDSEIYLATPCSPLGVPELWSRNGDGDTVLHLAIIHREFNMVLWILQQSLPDLNVLNIKNNLSQTALYLACFIGDHIIVKLLMEAGAKPELRDYHGNTPLHVACHHGNIECVKALCERFSLNSLKDYISCYNYDGKSCVHVVSGKNRMDILSILYGQLRNSDQFGLNHNSVCEHTHVETQTEKCAEERNLHDVGMLINLPEARAGYTLLHHAADNRDMQLLGWLLYHQKTLSLDLDTLTYSGYTAVELAQGRCYYDVVELLVMAGAHVSKPAPHIPSKPSDNITLSDLEISCCEHNAITEIICSDEHVYDDFIIRAI